jgi:hypothetical protein
MRRKVATLALAAMLTVGLAQTASAAVTSHISIAWNAKTERFHGKVTATDTECIAHRTVKLFKKTSSGRSLQGKTLSNSKGVWRIEVMHPHGHYFAVTPMQKIMNTECGRARSKTIDVM